MLKLNWQMANQELLKILLRYNVKLPEPPARQHQFLNRNRQRLHKPQLRQLWQQNQWRPLQFSKRKPHQLTILDN